MEEIKQAARRRLSDNDEQSSTVGVFQKTSQAKKDLIDIWRYIAQDNPSAADHLLDTIEEKGRLLADNPEPGHYRAIPAGIEMVRVVQGMRLLSALF